MKQIQSVYLLTDVPYNNEICRQNTIKICLKT